MRSNGGLGAGDGWTAGRVVMSVDGTTLARAAAASDQGPRAADWGGLVEPSGVGGGALGKGTHQREQRTDEQEQKHNDGKRERRGQRERERRTTRAAYATPPASRLRRRDGQLCSVFGAVARAPAYVQSHHGRIFQPRCPLVASLRLLRPSVPAAVSECKRHGRMPERRCGVHAPLSASPSRRHPSS